MPEIFVIDPVKRQGSIIPGEIMKMTDCSHSGSEILAGMKKSRCTTTSLFHAHLWAGGS